MTSKYFNFFEKTADIFISPEKSFQEIKEQNNTREGVYFLLFYSAFLGLIFGLIIGGLIGNLLISLLFLILFVIAALLNVVIWAGISFIITKVVFHGEGEFSNLFGLMSYSSVTYLFLIIGMTCLAFGKAIIASFMMFLLTAIWIIIIGTIAIESETKIGYGKSFLSCCGIPVLLIIVISFIMGVI